MLFYKNGMPPTIRPDRIRLEDGLTITNPSDTDLLNHGWNIAPEMPIAEYPNIVEWSDNNWIIRPPNEGEIAQRWFFIKETCKTKLSETDYKVIKALENTVINNTSLSAELDIKIVNYRQALRDIYNNVNNINPFFVQWPVLEETTNVA